MLREWQRNLLTADLDLRLCNFEVDAGRVLRVRTRIFSPMRLALGMVFCVPAVSLLYLSVFSPFGWPLVARFGLTLLSIFPLGGGLFLGTARIERRFDLARRSATHSIWFLGFETDWEVSLPSQGIVSLSSQWDEGPYWTFRTTADEIEGANFSICADYPRAVEFSRELALFLNWQFRDLTDHKSRATSLSQVRAISS